MKAVILAGGFGTRISEYTEALPKPMIEIGDIPILHHVMSVFASQGVTDFIIAAGYKAEVLKSYFLNMASLNSNFTVNLGNGDIVYHSRNTVNWRVTVVDTGLNTMTGGRLLRLKDFIGDELFYFTYGDGLANVDLSFVRSRFRERPNTVVALTAVNPTARFGGLDISSTGLVTGFKEKPAQSDMWVNGGYMVMSPIIFDYLGCDSDVLETTALPQIAEDGHMVACKHHGFWHCVDTKRDLDYMQGLWRENKVPPWLSREEY